ncbi:MAG TPA: CDP-alcohol phosphatidyltransferase family protein [Acidimicrobiales bacterium]|jgi:CDP-diacylglycerol--glycerol-3-phosphate 3-phosphatidyltransferase|nr:CDP-alcohol phosphatidyltransferase family protein [Acidimicrobiales bacterium]
MFDGRWRSHLDSATKPVGTALRRTGVSADHLTALGLFGAVATAVAVGSGHLLLGLFLLIASALPDLLDGAVAKASGTASPRGAFFDSVADRVTDSLVLGGIAWFLAEDRGGRWPLLAMAVLGTSTLISYQRAKAESLGYAAKGGLMERAERIVALCFGLAWPVLLVPVLWLMLALTSVTAVQRFVKVWRQASAPKPVRPQWGPELSERWRAWREQSLLQRAERRSERRAPRPRSARAGAGRWRRRAGTRP